MVSGFGAARILGPEAGLHVLDYEDACEESTRATARVRVAPTPAVLPDAAAEWQAALISVLEGVTAAASVVRRYRLDLSPLIRDATCGWCTGRQDLVLGGDFDLLADILPVGKRANARRRCLSGANHGTGATVGAGSLAALGRASADRASAAR